MDAAAHGGQIACEEQLAIKILRSWGGRLDSSSSSDSKDPLDEALDRLSPLAPPTLTIKPAAGSQPLPESTESAELHSDCREIAAYRPDVVDPPAECAPSALVTLVTPRTQDRSPHRTLTLESIGSGLQEAIDLPSGQRGKAVPIFRISDGPNLSLGDTLRELSVNLGPLESPRPPLPGRGGSGGADDTPLSSVRLHQLCTLGPSVSQRTLPLGTPAALPPQAEDEHPRSWNFPESSAETGSWVEVTAQHLGLFKWVVEMLKAAAV